MKRIELIFAACVWVFSFSSCSQSTTTQQLLDAGFYATGTQLPADLISPKNAAIASLQTEFVWTGAADARSYLLEISVNANMSNPVLRASLRSPEYIIAPTDFIGGSELREMPYFWRVSTVYPTKTEKSAIYKFTLYDKDIVYVNNASPESSELGTRHFPYKSIQPALSFARSSGRNQVWVSKGDYTEMIQIANGVALRGGYDAGASWTRNISGNVTRLRNSSDSTNVYCSAAASSNSILDGFTIQNTKTSGNLYGIYCESSSPTISNNTIQGSSTGTYYAVYVLSGSPTLSGNVINTDGYASHGIYHSSGSATISGNTLTISSTNSVSDVVGITVSGGNPTVQANNITCTGLPQNFYGIHVKSGAAATITANRIAGKAGSGFSNTGVFVQDLGTTATITNNLIYAGGGTMSVNYGISLEWDSVSTVSGNTINGGNGTGSNVGIRLGLGFGSFRNNIIFVSAGATQQCFREGYASIDPTVFENNNLFGCAVLYRDEGANDMTNGCGSAPQGFTGSYHTGAAGTTCSVTANTFVNNPTPPTGNVSIPNTSNQLFIDFDGPDNNLSTMADNDWHLTQNAAICNVRGGGLNLSATYTADRDGVSRTISTIAGCSPANAGAANWSMGAYESD